MRLNRRHLLGVASRTAAGAAATVALQASAAVASTPAPRRLTIVVTGGHPGDPEYGCGGTIAMLTRLGHRVVLLYLNDGAWQENSSAVRMAEAKHACELLGATPAYAGQQNGAAVVDATHYADFARRLQAEKPDAVFTHWPLDNHRDHRATAMLALDAWSAGGKTYPLYFYEVSDGEDTLQFAPSRYVDITATEPTKRAACYAHATQTPVRYYDVQDQVARFRGFESGHARAEAFLLQTQSPYDLFAGPLPAAG